MPACVDIWAWDLDVEAGVASLLSAEEQARANRFAFDVDRQRFLTARGRVRQILAGHIGADPAFLAFTRGEHGKPSLPGGPAFNFSDSANIGVLAISDLGPLGIDIEHHRSREFMKLAERYFSPAERARLTTMDEAAIPAAFYRGWTRKEAFLKAVGTGLATRLDAFEVTIGRDEPARMLRIDPSIDPDVSAWSLHVLDIASGFEAALAIRNAGEPVEIVVRESVRR